MPFENLITLAQIKPGHYGYSEDEIRSKEAALLLTFPEALRTFYLRFGNYQGVNNLFEDFLPLDQLSIEEEGYLIFYQEQQTGQKYGIQRLELPSKCPNVYYNESPITPYKWFFDNKNLEHSIIALGYDSATRILPFWNFQLEEIDPDDLSIIQNSFKKLPEELGLWNRRYYRKHLMIVFNYQPVTVEQV